MPITNQDIADVLITYADALEKQAENPYRIRAYLRAANFIRHYQKNIAEMVANEVNLTQIPTIGKHLAEKIIYYVNNNEINLPKESIAKPYPKYLIAKKRKPSLFRIYSVMPIIENIITHLKQLREIALVETTGDYRRKKEVVSDSVIMIDTSNPTKVFHYLHQLPSIKYIIETTEDHTIVQLKLGMRITVQMVNSKNWAKTLLQLTGSDSHYQTLQSIAEKNKTSLSGKTEAMIYKKLGMDFIAPELRENRGEIKLAQKNQLPHLVALSDIQGDLHCHTNETDGRFSLEEMVNAAKEHGYAYVAITDHSQSLKLTNGMDEKRLLNQIKQIDKLNEKLFPFRILKSMEIDILEDGSLDLKKSVLKELDLTVCSVHSKFRLPLEKQTNRIIRAMDNPYFNILGHATGRLIFSRKPYEIDMERILQAAKERHCFIEVNCQPARLDINDVYCQRAKALGVKVSISSDAHTLQGFDFMVLGVNQARRGGLEKSDVINTYSLAELKALIKK